MGIGAGREGKRGTEKGTGGRKVNILEMQHAQVLHPRQRGPIDLGWGWSQAGLARVSATHPAEACCLLGRGGELGHKAASPR